jgi:hypothetical protein
MKTKTEVTGAEKKFRKYFAHEIHRMRILKEGSVAVADDDNGNGCN